MKRFRLVFAVSFLCVGIHNASAGTVSLNDWCFSVNGDLSTCNGSGSSNPAVDIAAFDTTYNPNGLGVATIALAAGSNQYAGFYADYDIDYADYLSYNDNASTTGTLASGQSYSINDPNAWDGTGYTLFDAFDADTLDDGNDAGTPDSGDPQCCDIAFAMMFSDINLDSDETAVVTFTVSSAPPPSGFYITQSSNDSTQPSVYLSGTVDVTELTSTPEPSTFVLGGGVLVLAGFFTRRRWAASSRS